MFSMLTSVACVFFVASVAARQALVLRCRSVAVPLLLLFAVSAAATDDRLMARYQRVDTTLTAHELQTLYLRYASTGAYAESLAPLPHDAIEAVAQRPLSLQALYEAAVAMKRQGKTRRMKRYARQMWMLGEMLYRCFVGDAAQPYPLLYREDEHLMLYNWNGIDSIVSETCKPQYDVVECALPPDWIDFYYFRLLYPSPNK